MSRAEDVAVENYLFRFFDFTVEPGKRYIYRVKLAVSNPNYNMKPVYLEKPEMAKTPFLVQKDWSKPSSPISVANDTSALALGVEQPKRATSEPLGGMLVASWQQDTGMKVYNKFAVERGQLLNFKGAKVEAAQRRTGGPTLSPDDTTLHSEVLVVDMSGGKKLPMVKPKQIEYEKDQYDKTLPPLGAEKGAVSPGEILVMDPDGTLVVRNEFDDMAKVDSYISGPTQPAPGAPRGPGGAMPGGFGGPGMMGGPGILGGPGHGGTPGGAPPGYGNLFGPQPKQPNTPKK
jgi:hypothetical protein